MFRPELKNKSDQRSPVVLKEIYRLRFEEADMARKEAIWQELGKYLQRYVDPTGGVVDIACDVGYFIRNIRASERWATDIRDVGGALPPDVHFVHASGLELVDAMPNNHFDLAFMSNYLEHLPSTEAVVQQLRVAWSLLKPGGRLLVLQPNIRLIGGSYWDFIDHQTALTEKSLGGAGELGRVQTEPDGHRFNPLPEEGRFSPEPILVRAY